MVSSRKSGLFVLIATLKTKKQKKFKPIKQNPSILLKIHIAIRSKQISPIIIHKYIQYINTHAPLPYLAKEMQCGNKHQFTMY